jgi:hypothetical protein
VSNPAPSYAWETTGSANNDLAFKTYVAGPSPPPDTDPPETGITKEPAAKSKRKRVKFEFFSDEPGAAFECKLDQKLFKPCTSPATYKVKVGKHKFKVRAIDAAGNVDPAPDKVRFRVVSRRRS